MMNTEVFMNIFAPTPMEVVFTVALPIIKAVELRDAFIVGVPTEIFAENTGFVTLA